MDCCRHVILLYVYLNFLKNLNITTFTINYGGQRSFYVLDTCMWSDNYNSF